MTQTNLTQPQGLNRLDPVLREAASELGVVEFRAESLPAERERANKLGRRTGRGQSTPRVCRGRIAVHRRPRGRAAGPSPLPRQREGTSRAPLALYAHGGGFVTGNLDTDHAQCVELARAAGCVLVSVDYRLAPENPCRRHCRILDAALRYAIDNSSELDADPGRIVVIGRDAGAALVAGLAQHMFDNEGGPQILMQILHQPMLDCDATPSRREFQRTPGLNVPPVSRAWGHYLGADSTDGQHVPAHRANLEGLPPTFISCSEIDPCRDEAIAYANRLLHAFVHTELHVIAATFNGFDAALPDWLSLRRTWPCRPCRCVVCSRRSNG